MKLTNRRFLAVPAALLALSALALGAGSTSVAHAGTVPAISAAGFAGGVNVTGTGFTPKGKVTVGVFYASGPFETNTTVTALGPHWVCHTTSLGPVCSLDPGGEINATLYAQPGYVKVHARDLTTGLGSNWVKTYVFPIP